MRATSLLILGLALTAACGGSGGSAGDGSPVNSSRATRGSSALDALAAGGGDGQGGSGGRASGAGGGAGGTPGGGGSSGGAGGQAGSGMGAGGSPSAGGSAGTAGAGGGIDAAAADIPGETPIADAGPGACEQGGICERLVSAYTRALERARSCMPAAAAQCMASAPDSLECPDCPVWVNDSTQLAALQAEARAGGCDRCVRRCPERPCRGLRRGVCQPVGGILLPTSHACGEATLLP